MRTSFVASTLLVLAAFATAPVRANPIPLPTPAAMPLEHMTVNIGNDLHVSFSGQFTFTFIPADVTKMQFPMPPGAVTNVAVTQDGLPLPAHLSADPYVTVLPEYPTVPMIEWDGPFPEPGAVFGVAYEHDLFRRGDDWVFFYSLGTGKVFPTYEKETTALFDITLPAGASLVSLMLDNTPVDPAAWTLTGSLLHIELTSRYGPFTRDLIMTLNVVPEPGVAWLLVLGLVTLPVSRRLAGRGNCV